MRGTSGVTVNPSGSYQAPVDGRWKGFLKSVATPFLNFLKNPDQNALIDIEINEVEIQAAIYAALFRICLEKDGKTIPIQTQEFLDRHKEGGLGVEQTYRFLVMSDDERKESIQKKLLLQLFGSYR